MTSKRPKTGSPFGYATPSSPPAVGEPGQKATRTDQSEASGPSVHSKQSQKADRSPFLGRPSEAVPPTEAERALDVVPLTPETLYKIEEVAALFRVSTKTVGRWVKAGVLERVVLTGRLVRISGAELARLCKSGGKSRSAE